MKVKIYNESTNSLPAYQTPDSAGMDVRAMLPESKSKITIMPRDRIMIGTGISVAIPRGYEIQVRPRSGLAIKYGITIVNSIGTIDSDYRGEIKVLLINHGIEPFELLQGEKIAQLVLNKVEQIEWEKVSTTVSLGETDRGIGGFGHTGRT